MPRPSRNAEVEEEVVAEEESPVEEEVVAEAPKVRASKSDAVTVVYRAGSREYTRTEHGDDFVALAKEFAEKKNGTIV